MHILVVLFLFFASSLADATCYRADGVSGNENWKVCNTDADVSPCCSANDYCLSNGLCLDASGDNGFSIQGCTDAGWGKPCQLYCNASLLDSGGYLRLWLCDLDGTNAGRYCCGDAGCCQTSSSYVTDIPLFSSVYRAEGAATSTGDASSTATATSSASSTNSNPSSSPSNSAKDSSNDNRNLAIGLGVGIPLGLFLVAALSFVGFQLRKRNSILSNSGYHAPSNRDVTNMDQPPMQDIGQNPSPQPKDTYYQETPTNYDQASSSYAQTPQQYQELSDTHIAELPQHPHSPR